MMSFDEEWRGRCSFKTVSMLSAESKQQVHKMSASTCRYETLNSPHTTLCLTLAPIVWPSLKFVQYKQQRL